jgi:hypothetical protein
MFEAEQKTIEDLIRMRTVLRTDCLQPVVQLELDSFQRALGHCNAIFPARMLKMHAKKARKLNVNQRAQEIAAGDRS